MEITGFDYVFYSNVSAFAIEEEFIAKVKELWPHLLVEEFERREDSYLELFFARDQKMFDDHDKFGFTLNPNGESCFMLLSRKRGDCDFNVKVNVQNTEADIGAPMEEDAQIFLRNTWSITLVVPEMAEDSSFVQFIYDCLSSAIRNCAFQN